jgi:hypothetical protein
MLNKTRLFFGVLVACSSAFAPLLAAGAQDAVSSQDYLLMNRVQQAAASGFIDTAQANDLMNRCKDILSKDQQWSLQDGGNLNVPDRLDLQAKLKSVARRLNKDIQNNTSTTTGSNILPGLYSSTLPYGNGSTYGYGSRLPYNYGNTLPYGYNTTGSTSPYSAYPLYPTAYTGASNYNGVPYNVPGVFQGLLNRWRGY